MIDVKTPRAKSAFGPKGLGKAVFNAIVRKTSLTSPSQSIILLALEALGSIKTFDAVGDKTIARQAGVGGRKGCGVVA